MRFNIKKVRRYITDNELLEDMKRAAAALISDSLSIRKYDVEGEFNSSTIISRFGSWNNALGEAGLKVKRPRSCTKKELFENVLLVWKSKGRQPKLADMSYGVSMFSRRFYLKIFGSWYNALKELEEFIKSGGAARSLINPLNELSSEVNPRNPGLRLRMAVLKRDRFRCVLCGASPAGNEKVKLEIDHIIPWSKGGKTSLENLQSLCSACNNGKSDETL